MSRSWRTSGSCSVLRAACSVASAAAVAARPFSRFSVSGSDRFVEAGDAELTRALGREAREDVEQDLRVTIAHRNPGAWVLRRESAGGHSGP